MDQRLDLARELLEHKVLVLHLGAEPRRLEQPLTVAPTRARVRSVPRGDFGRGQEPRQIDEPIDVADEPVVLGVKDRVHAGQGDVLVAATIAGHEVQVEQLVVVGAGCCRIAARGLRRIRARSGDQVGVRTTRCGDRIVRHVIQELMIRPECVGGDVHGAAVGRQPALQHDVARQHQLREPVRARLEMAVGIGQQQRHVEQIRVGEVDAKLGPRLCLDLAPVADVANHLAGDPVGAGPAEPAVEHLAILNRRAADHHVLAEEHLMGRMRGVGLVLIHPRGRLVDPVVVRVDRRPGHGHCVEDWIDARPEQRIIRLQRHDDRAVAALVHQVEAVVEELAEKGEQQVVRRGETEVGRDVRDEERTGISRSRKGCRTSARITQGRSRGAHEAARAARVCRRRGG